MLKFIFETATISFFLAIVLYLPEIIKALSTIETGILIGSMCFTIATLLIGWWVNWMAWGKK